MTKSPTVITQKITFYITNQISLVVFKCTRCDTVLWVILVTYETRGVSDLW